MEGCGPTCLAMIVCGLKNDPAINPYEVSKYSADSNFYIYGEGTSWSLMTEGARHYGLNVSEGTISPEYIIDNLSSSTPMICSMTPGDFMTSGHFIVLTGVDSNGKIIVNDPNSRKNSKNTGMQIYWHPRRKEFGGIVLKYIFFRCTRGL